MISLRHLLTLCNEYLLWWITKNFWGTNVDAERRLSICLKLFFWKILFCLCVGICWKFVSAYEFLYPRNCWFSKYFFLKQMGFVYSNISLFNRKTFLKSYGRLFIHCIALLNIDYTLLNKQPIAERLHMLLKPNILLVKSKCKKVIEGNKVIKVKGNIINILLFSAPLAVRSLVLLLVEEPHRIA